MLLVKMIMFRWVWLVKRNRIKVEQMKKLIVKTRMYTRVLEYRRILQIKTVNKQMIEMQTHQYRPKET